MTDQTLETVLIEAVFLNEEGVRVGDGNDLINDLAPDRKVRFDAGFIGDDPNEVDSYELSVEI